MEHPDLKMRVPFDRIAKTVLPDEAAAPTETQQSSIVEHTYEAYSAAECHTLNLDEWCVQAVQHRVRVFVEQYKKVCLDLQNISGYANLCFEFRSFSSLSASLSTMLPKGAHQRVYRATRRRPESMDARGRVPYRTSYISSYA
jgi:hypothetical protein